MKTSLDFFDLMVEVRVHYREALFENVRHFSSESFIMCNNELGKRKLQHRDPDVMKIQITRTLSNNLNVT